MATRSQDQHLVDQVATTHPFQKSDLKTGADHEKEPCQVIPCLGWHPWFSYQIYDDRDDATGGAIDKGTHYRNVITQGPLEDSFIASLPEPRPLSAYLAETKSYLEKYPLALVGEIGLDRSFRIPEGESSPGESPAETGLTPGGRDGRQLSSHRVELSHQKLVLQAQLRLAGEMSRAVSVHGVAGHGVVLDAIAETWKGFENEVVSKRLRKRRGSASMAHVFEDHDGESQDGQIGKNGDSRPYPPRICLHSYSGPPEALKQYFHPSVPATIFFSFSSLINFSTSAAAKAAEVIKKAPHDRLLIESDLHCAGERMDGLLEDIVRKVCDIRGWSLEDGVQQLGRNWKHFVLGIDDEI